MDISYLNLAGTFYFLITLLDGYSRYVVHLEISPTMLEFDMEVVVQRALEKYPGETPRIITDNGPQFIARDFKEFIRLVGLTHVRLHSALGYITPADKLNGLEAVNFAERDRKLEDARQRSKQARQALQEVAG